MCRLIHLPFHYRFPAKKRCVSNGFYTKHRDIFKKFFRQYCRQLWSYQNVSCSAQITRMCRRGRPGLTRWLTGDGGLDMRVIIRLVDSSRPTDVANGCQWRCRRPVTRVQPGPTGATADIDHSVQSPVLVVVRPPQSTGTSLSARRQLARYEMIGSRERHRGGICGITAKSAVLPRERGQTSWYERGANNGILFCIWKRSYARRMWRVQRLRSCMFRKF